MASACLLTLLQIMLLPHHHHIYQSGSTGAVSRNQCSQQEAAAAPLAHARCRCAEHAHNRSYHWAGFRGNASAIGKQQPSHGACPPCC